MSKIAMTKAQRRKFEATVADARKTARDATDTVRDAADEARRAARDAADRARDVADRARDLGREGKRRGRAAGQALAGHEPARKPWFLLVGAIGAAIGAVAALFGRRAAETRRLAEMEDMSASVAAELGVDETPATATVTGVPVTPAVNGAVPPPRTGNTTRPV